MMNVIRRKPSATEKLNAHAAPGNASRNQATPPTLDVSGIDHNREGMGIRAANVLPDLRLSGFDFDKIMGQAGLGFPSPLGTTDNKDIGPIRPGDYITNNASIPGKCTVSSEVFANNSSAQSHRAHRRRIRCIVAPSSAFLQPIYCDRGIQRFLKLSTNVKAEAATDASFHLDATA